MNGHKPNRRTGALRKGERGGLLTSAVQYTAEEVEFGRAVEAWKVKTGRKFPAHSEYLAILRSLGYEKKEQP